ncbi:Hypothetical_protein [Hexamita inflata]|uniref:Hypothetical_protein n=1 Tax=Hexamita inflata TaxID=28002 RepID=A0AA86TSM4_9EUKA|nr:Hypothetical protein HINF_LOCUS8508 [Hexamita inflata]
MTDQLLRDIGRSDKAQTKPPMFMISGNDSSFKLQLAAKLVGCERPLEFDAVNGITILGSEIAQIMVLGSATSFIQSSQNLLSQTIQRAIIIIQLQNPTQTIQVLKMWLQQLKNTPVTIVISDYENLKKLDPQSLKICFNLIRQLASFFQTQLITLFENAHMSDCVNAIRGQAKENRIDEKGNKFFIAVPEPKNEAEYKKFNDMFQQHVQQNVKAVPIITDLKSYYQYVENKSKCGAE